MTRLVYALGVCLFGLALACGPGTPEQASDSGVDDAGVADAGGDEELPFCVDQEGGTEYAVHDDEMGNIVLLNEAGGIIDEAPATVQIGAACEVPGLQGQCRIGEVQCTSSGLRCEQVNVPSVEIAGFDGIDHSCDGFDRYLNEAGEPHVIYVHSGVDSPSLGEAIALAAECGLEIGGQQIPCDVFVQGSNLLTSEETVTLIEGVHVYGRFDTDRWDPTDGEFSAPSYDSSVGNSRVRVESTLGMVARGVEATTPFFGITIETPDRAETAGCGANIGAFVHSSPGLWLRQVEIVSGRAPHGVDGAAGETEGSGQTGGYFEGAVAASIAPGGLGGNNGGDSGSGECPVLPRSVC